MVSAIDQDDFDFKNSKYRPLFSTPDFCPSMAPYWMENHFKDPLENRAAIISSEGNFTTYLIDTTIKAKIPSAAFREEKVSHWKERNGTAKKWAWLEGIFCGACGTTAGILALGVAGAGPAAIVLGVASIAASILMGRNIYKAYEASRQIKGWSANLLQKIAEARADAYRIGFPYVLAQDLKLQVGVASPSKILLPEEVTFLFERYFNEFPRKLPTQNLESNQGKKEWLDGFTRCNPVSKKALAYAYYPVPDKYSQVSSDFEVLHEQLTNLRGEFDKLRRETRAKSENIIRGINDNRALALAPFTGALIYYKLQAGETKRQELEKTTNPTKIKKINQEYDAAILKYETYHLAATFPINTLFDSQVSEAQRNLRNILQQINEKEAISHAPYFNYAWGLLDYAIKMKNGAQPVYVAQNLSPAQIFQIQAPLAPPLVTINFFQEAVSQRPSGVDASQYADYLKFVRNPSR